MSILQPVSAVIFWMTLPPKPMMMPMLPSVPPNPLVMLATIC